MADDPPPSSIAQSSTCTDYRRLREEEVETLRAELSEFDKNTKIPEEEMKGKKELVDWLLKLVLNEVKLKNLTWKQPFKTGSAYEKVQAGEAVDFDVMIFLDISKGVWKVEEDTRPGFCTITLERLRGPRKGKDGKEINQKAAKKRHQFIGHLLNSKRQLSALKVRKLFTGKIDQVLKRKSPLTYKYKEKVDGTGAADEKPTEVEKSAIVKVLRKQRGPATTLAISCPELNIATFTLDIVSCLHASQLSSKNDRQRSDFVAKPIDKQNAFTAEYEHLWRRSYSRQESKKFKSIDAENKIHRRVLRIFKILRTNQSQLKCLKSYIFKNVLLFLSTLPDKSWNETDLPNRFVDMIIALRNCLAANSVPVFFNRDINLLAEYKSTQLDKIRGYLRRVANKGIDGYKGMLSLKEKEEMMRIADAQRRQKKRKRKVRPPKVKSTPTQLDLSDLLATPSTSKGSPAKKAKGQDRTAKKGKTKRKDVGLSVDAFDEFHDFDGDIGYNESDEDGDFDDSGYLLAIADEMDAGLEDHCDEAISECVDAADLEVESSCGYDEAISGYVEADDLECESNDGYDEVDEFTDFAVEDYVPFDSEDLYGDPSPYNDYDDDDYDDTDYYDM